MSAITHRAAVARLKTFEADLHNLVKAIAEGRRIDALIQMTLAEMAMLISCLETPADPASTDVHYQSARAAAEAVAHDAFERSGGEPPQPQPQPVMRAEFDRVAAMVGDLATTVSAVESVINQTDHKSVVASMIQTLEERVGALENDVTAALWARIAGLSNRIDGSVARQDFYQLAATVGDIANTLGRERVVERLSQLEAMTLDKRIDGLRARLDGQRIAGDDLASRVAALEKLTDLEAWRELAAAHVVAARALHARVRKLGPGIGGAS